MQSMIKSIDDQLLVDTTNYPPGGDRHALRRDHPVDLVVVAETVALSSLK